MRNEVRFDFPASECQQNFVFLVIDSILMSRYHVLSKESQYWEDYKQSSSRLKEYLLTVSEQLWIRQHELLKELLFIYPVDKLANENKYTMLGIHLPDSDLLLGEFVPVFYVFERVA